MSMFLGGSRVGGIITDQLVMSIDPSNALSYRNAVSATSVRDLSGRNANATTTGTYVTTAGGGIDFSGTNAITATSTSALRLGSFSMGVWVYMNTVSPNGQYILRLFPTDVVYAFGFNITVGQMEASIATVNGSAATRLYATATATTFQYWTMTYNHPTTTMALYLNGVSQSSTPSAVTPGTINTTSFYIFGNSSGGSNPSGIIYAGHIYNKALSATEVLQNFNATRSRFGV